MIDFMLDDARRVIEVALRDFSPLCVERADFYFRKPLDLYLNVRARQATFRRRLFVSTRLCDPRIDKNVTIGERQFFLP